jgi:tetratricopeptide (TPR) repeat protein
VFKLSFAGVIFFSVSSYAQFPIAQPQPRIIPGTTLRTPFSERSMFDGFPQAASEPSPVTAVVSLRELQHPIPRKAAQKAYDAQKLTKANKLPQAIAKLEEAIRIAPEYRDAHWNLGGLYGKLGRSSEARDQFLKALEIGPAASPIYFNLALLSLDEHKYVDARKWAAKALELDPANGLAKQVREFALSH